VRARHAPHLAIVLVLVLALVIAACGDDDGGAASETSSTITEDTVEPTPGMLEVRRTGGIDYTGTGSFRTLDVWAPSEAGEWPVVIVVPGVGQQSKASFTPLARAIAERGAVVFNLAVDDSVPFITAIEQTACAVRYARAEAAGYGGDPESITLVGNSMGAPVAAVVALAGDAFPGPCAAEGSSVATGFVGYEGAYDYVREADYLLVDHRYLEDEDPAMYAAIDPYTHFGENPSLAIHLVHGVDDDSLWFDIPPGESVSFNDALVAAGHESQLTLVEGASSVDLMNPDTDAFAAVVEATVGVAGI